MGNPVKIVALYKTFSGEEWMEASLESIYPFVDKILVVHSDIDWLGQCGNTVMPVVARWRRQYDKQNKLVELRRDTSSQSEQYRYGLEWIDMNCPDHITFLVDTDEIWDARGFNNAVRHIQTKPNINAFKCRMHTYVKSPFFRVEPPESCCPLVFVRDRRSFAGLRGNKTPNSIVMDDVYFHHFTLVRKQDTEIRQKVMRVCAAENLAPWNAVNWFKEKWDKLPHAIDFHHSARNAKCWHSCKVVTPADLPPVVLDKDIVKAFMQSKG